MILWVHDNWPRQTDREQRRLAEKGDPKYIFTIPRAILPKPSLCDEITETQSLLRGQFVRGQFVAVSWLGSWFYVQYKPDQKANIFLRLQ